MPIALHHEGGDTYRLDISGRVERPEYVRLEEELAATLETRADFKSDHTVKG